MLHLRWISYALMVAGLLVVLLALAAGFGPGVLLTGVMLALAGAVKVAVVAIWSTIARFDGEEGGG
ncbi:MAG: hypothetical protein H0W06_09055 [Chloroflexia bacterium]|nr:hypothetical protein [Chloroflexia bacterium]